MKNIYKAWGQEIFQSVHLVSIKKTYNGDLVPMKIVYKAWGTRILCFFILIIIKVIDSLIAFNMHLNEDKGK